eukprot:CAMPEP_0115758124 /NCGR_PEP_ID=MMETSP0272-20121206/98772_1 /TAXON_ID=71861 /ORGANISM="Scrippsiella trochoidea, Strain CCMP3099" /LENGTH=53 /DNA_ID=CAMNT_0003203649 /DNA_START=225 /DNA_END=387 /DNA_ORIENTATION=-
MRMASMPRQPSNALQPPVAVSRTAAASDPGVACRHRRHEAVHGARRADGQLLR